MKLHPLSDLSNVTNAWYTENSQAIVHSDDNDVAIGSHDTSVVCISGSEFVRFTVNEENDRHR